MDLWLEQARFEDSCSFEMTVLEEPSEECEPPLHGVLLGRTSLWLEEGVGEATEFCDEIRDTGLVLVIVSLSPDEQSAP